MQFGYYIYNYDSCYLRIYMEELSFLIAVLILLLLSRKYAYWFIRNVPKTLMHTSFSARATRKQIHVIICSGRSR